MKQTWPSDEDKLFVAGEVKNGEIQFIFASRSSSTVREINFYAVSEEAAKLMAHEYCRVAKRNFVSLRPAVTDLAATIANYKKRNDPAPPETVALPAVESKTKVA